MASAAAKLKPSPTGIGNGQRQVGAIGLGGGVPPALQAPGTAHRGAQAERATQSLFEAIGGARSIGGASRIGGSDQRGEPEAAAARGQQVDRQARHDRTVDEYRVAEPDRGEHPRDRRRGPCRRRHGAAVEHGTLAHRQVGRDDRDRQAQLRKRGIADTARG